MALQKRERHFIIGIIYGVNGKGKEVVEAVQLYNPITKESNIESLKSIKQRLLEGQEIVGVRLKPVKRYSAKEEDFIINKTPVLNKTIYNYKKLSKLNGKGEVIEKGKEVIIGTKMIDNHEKYMIINNLLEIKYLDKEEVIKEKYVGVIRDVIGKPSQIEIV